MQHQLVQLEADHPGFHDGDYRRRRDEIAQLAFDYQEGTPLPRVEYSPLEVGTWRTVFRELTKLFPTHACSEFNQSLTQIGFHDGAIPQHADVDAYLQSTTGFHIRPVAGLLSAREFLQMLARRQFPATQYIRHHSAPGYTPEPDVIHELLGHAPMLGVQAYADLSAQFGTYSLHANDVQIDCLSRLYWYTVEFGVLRQNGQIRAYGSGHLSSFGELSRTVSGTGAAFLPFDPEEAALRPYDPTQMQPLLYVVDSIQQAFDLSCEFAERMLRRG
jgi:phenylalanine-4-hydroxylase